MAKYLRDGYHFLVLRHFSPQLTEIIQIPVKAGARNTHNDCLFNSVPKANKIAPNICSNETNVGRTFAIAISVTHIASKPQ